MDKVMAWAGLPVLVLGCLTVFGGPMALIYRGLVAPKPAPSTTALQAEPCPETTPEALTASGHKFERSFKFDGVGYALRHGQAECTLTRPKGKFDPNKLVICQFSAPVALLVTTAEKTHAYRLNSKSATVWFEGATPRCAADSDLNIVRRLAARGLTSSRAP